MATENTLPPCPLPDCEGGEHHYHDIDADESAYGWGEDPSAETHEHRITWDWYPFCTCG